eukprot:CAMPEP_0181113574 /NCGR_PEP_ID=MMETSP1071-20121207/20420_1 /TAXON_ID=35127 /ORGANISM="Thalassiosira sp., Strain NH16" /LENGTH=192 /DNA_ID=CAMNT_0023197621 /DNA_START=32 /DNA_END=610 /DNA_ORIENTATION=+
MIFLTRLLTLAAVLFSPSSAFSASEGGGKTSKISSRRSVLIGGAASILAGVVVGSPSSASAGTYKLGDKSSVVGREIRSFEGLIYSFKNTALDGGLDASKIKEPSVPFIEFGEKMKNGEVAFVEFFAPSGEVAYATFKDPKSGKEADPIRIGQGYPTGGKNSWSSPDYVIRSVSNYGVPYKFTVPMLANYNS